MWFKNLQVYRIPAPWAISAEHLEAFLAPQAFTECSSLELQSQGWVSPRADGRLVHAVNRQYLLQLNTEKKLLPASVINQVAKARAAEIEEQQGFAPGRKQMKVLKEDVTDELLPRAFSIMSSTHVWIDPANGWLVIDATSTSKAEDILKLLLRSIDKFPVQSLRVKRSPVAVMTEWLAADEAPHGFTVDQDAELRASGESRATVRYIRHTLEEDDTRRHIASGKQCTRLAMTWADRVSFVLTESLAIKRIAPLDILKENSDGTSINDDERFDADFLLMAGEFNRMLTDVIESLGGESIDQTDWVQETSKDSSVGTAIGDLNRLAAQDGVTATVTDGAGNVLATFGDGPDPLYDQAVEVVLQQRRASISLVQRHFRIGYNRAARLIEQMELQGVVSPMNSSGSRTILTSTQ